MKNPTERHYVRFVLIRPGDILNDTHEGNSHHLLGIVPAKGRKLAAYAIYSVHAKTGGPTTRSRKR